MGLAAKVKNFAYSNFSSNQSFTLGSLFSLHANKVDDIMKKAMKGKACRMNRAEIDEVSEDRDAGFDYEEDLAGEFEEAGENTVGRFIDRFEF